MNQPSISEYIYLFPVPSRVRLQRCKELESRGPMGLLASMLYRVANAFMLAELYDSIAPICGEPYSDHPRKTFERKLHEVALLLCGSSDYCGIRWGWHGDDRCMESPWVMSIELPIGGIQYRTPRRGQGPTYQKEQYLGTRNIESIDMFCEAVLGGYVIEMMDQ